MVEDRFREVQCLKCGSIGLLSNGLCRVPGCGATHTVRVI
jgi:hypothetical protein